MKRIPLFFILHVRVWGSGKVEPGQPQAHLCRLCSAPGTGAAVNVCCEGGCPWARWWGEVLMELFCFPLLEGHSEAGMPYFCSGTAFSQIVVLLPGPRQMHSGLLRTAFGFDLKLFRSCVASSQLLYLSEPQSYFLWRWRRGWI